MKNLSNKWTRAAIPALLLHCSIGTVYCWSYLEDAIKTVFFLWISNLYGLFFNE